MLTLVVAAYLLVWGAGFIFVSQEFGIVSAIKLSLIPVLPLVVALRMCSRWPTVRGREFAFLLALVIIVSGAAVGVLWNWYDTGMDRFHAEDLEYAEFVRTLRKDPAFHNVKPFVSPKHLFWLRGTVASDADLARLRSLADQGRFIRWNDELEVAGPNKRTQDKKSKGESHRGGKR
jgi:hypothetical protein